MITSLLDVGYLESLGKPLIWFRLPQPGEVSTLRLSSLRKSQWGGRRLDLHSRSDAKLLVVAYIWFFFMTACPHQLLKAIISNVCIYTWNFAVTYKQFLGMHRVLFAFLRWRRKRWAHLLNSTMDVLIRKCMSPVWQCRISCNCFGLLKNWSWVLWTMYCKSSLRKTVTLHIK